MTLPGQRFDFLRSFLLYADCYNLMPQGSSRFQREQREPAITGNEPVFHLITPRPEESRNAIISSSSALGGTSARIRSSACVVFSFARVSNRKAVCNPSIVWDGKPRLSKPVRLAPNTLISRELTTVENG